MVKKKRHRETQMLNTELKYYISGVFVNELAVSTVILCSSPGHIGGVIVNELAVSRAFI